MRRAKLAAAIFAGLCGGLAACGGTDPINDPSLMGVVSDRFKAWVQAWNTHTPAALEPFYLHAGHLTVTWPNGERTRGWDAEHQMQQTFLPSVTTMNLVPREPVIVLLGKDQALVSFAFSLDMGADGNRQIGPGQGLMLWQDRGGAWRIVAAQLSYGKATEARVPTARR
jgi:hypothetical protein